MAKRRGVEVPKTLEIDVPAVTARPVTDNETSYRLPRSFYQALKAHYVAL